LSGEAAIAVENTGVVEMTAKYSVELKDVGKKLPQVYFNSGEDVAKLTTRCWCVIFADMTLNDIVCATESEIFLLRLKYGARCVISDWTEKYGLTPEMLRSNDEYLGTGTYGTVQGIHHEITFDEVYNWQD
jgi:hypothetical protein